MSDAEIEDVRRNAREYLALWQRDYQPPQPRVVAP